MQPGKITHIESEYYAPQSGSVRQMVDISDLDMIGFSGRHDIYRA